MYYGGHLVENNVGGTENKAGLSLRGIWLGLRQVSGFFQEAKIIKEPKVKSVSSTAV